MSQETVTFVRHLQDEDNLLAGWNDAPLLSNQEYLVGNAVQDIVTRYELGDFTGIRIYTSPKKRAVETAAMIGSKILSLVSTSPELIADDRIRELDQGNYILPPNYKPGDYYSPLSIAWNVYFNETFFQSHPNPFYRFGDPMALNDAHKYPELIGIFTKYGETQTEFNIRFYDFIISLCEELERNPDQLHIVVTHHAIVARTLELKSIFTKTDEPGEVVKNSPFESQLSIPFIGLGALPTYEWLHLPLIMEVNNYFKTFGAHGSYDLSNIVKFASSVAVERDVQVAKMMQQRSHE